jgi:ubiquinone/menaquinone biosynthesis C-methylase UbiE
MQFYPDIEDKNIIKFIQDNEPYPGYWEKSEEFVFSYFEKIVKNNNYSRLLDLGCGGGRLIKRFSNYFNEVIALEPDKKRIEKAKNLVQKEKLDNINFINESFLDVNFPSEEFDVVICSHIVQHVNTDDLSKIFEKVNFILKKNGILMITTNHSKNKQEFFMKNMIQNGKVVEKEISRKEFNRLIMNYEKVLPIHYFSIEDLKEHLKGFDLINIKVFHSLFPLNVIDSLIFRDKIINSPCIKRFFGRDVMIIASKK